MSLYSQFATNKEAEAEGAWTEYGPNEDGTIPRFKLSRMSKSNKRYQKELERATKPHRRSMELETMDNDLAEKLMMEVFVDTILLDWENIDDKEGNRLSFSRENALKLFKDLPELYDDLQDKARKASLFREASLEDEAKN